MTLSIGQKYNKQADDSCVTHGINDQYLKDLEDRRPVIYLGLYSGEAITLAKAITDISDKVRVIMSYFCENSGRQGFLELRGNEIGPAFIFSSSYEHTQDNRCSEHGTGNAHEIQRLTGDKYLTNYILKRNGIPVPRQKKITARNVSKSSGRTLRNERLFNLVNFESSNFDDCVIKSREGCGGFNVEIYRGGIPVNGSQLLNQRCIIEELIEAYPIEILAGKMDWNLRVLVTFDSKSERYVTAGITGRMDRVGGPVNRSLSAQNISFKDIAELCGWTSEEYTEIKGKVEKTAELSSEILVRAGNRKGEIPKYTNFQTLFGVDIIINKNKEVIVIEVNDSGSGCIFELGELEGIESIYPIAQAIIYKTRLLQSIPHFSQMMEYIAEDTGIPPSILVDLYNKGEVYLTEENGNFKINIPEEYIKGAGNSQ